MTTSKTVAIVTLPGFNEIDSFVAARMSDSVPDLAIELVGPAETAISMAGVEVATPGELEALHSYAAVIVGSGFQTFDHIDNEAMMSRFSFDRSGGQPIGSQCSGAAILHRLGLIDGVTVCTDLTTTPKLLALGVDVANESFRAEGTVATAGGCLSSAYLAFWTIAQLSSTAAAIDALSYVAPVGENEDLVNRALLATGLTAERSVAVR